jgi:hypothetical protein
MTFAIAFALASIASEAVVPSVVTPADSLALSGVVVTEPVPTTLSVPAGGSLLSAWIMRGAPTPAIADAASTRALIQTMLRTFIDAYTAPTAITSQAVDQAAVALPSGPSPRYGAHVCGIFGAAIRMKSEGEGGVGWTRILSPISSTSLSPLRRLQGAQEVTTFSQTESPPLLRGTTWSSVNRPAEPQ